MEGDESLSLKEEKYKGWDALRIQRGPLELILVPQIGGRIMGLLWRGHDLLFTQPEREGELVDLSGLTDVRAKKKKMGFPLWGGDKTWLAPQNRWTEAVPFLDLDSGPYDLIVDHKEPEKVAVEMTSKICRETGVRITRTLTLSYGSEEWVVKHQMTNKSVTEVEWGLWGVAMVLRPGLVYLPKRASSAYPGGVKTFSEEGDSVQAREEVLGGLGNLAVLRCQESRKFKYGVDTREGWLLAVVDTGGNGLVGYRKQVQVDPEKPYAHGCVAEVFNSDRYPYFEMEIHSPLIRLRPDESYELTETQELFEVSRWPQDEGEMRQHLKQC